MQLRDALMTVLENGGQFESCNGSGLIIKGQKGQALFRNSDAHYVVYKGFNLAFQIEHFCTVGAAVDCYLKLMEQYERTAA